MAEPIYKGYSSFEFQARDTFLLTDVELVKLDLLNHIFTRRGERVKMAQFGTRIPDLAFEPLDQETLDILYEDLDMVFKFDPRVEAENITITPNYDENSVEARARLRYIELAVVDTLDLNITVGQNAT